LISDSESWQLSLTARLELIPRGLLQRIIARKQD